MNSCNQGANAGGSSLSQLSSDPKLPIHLPEVSGTVPIMATQLRGTFVAIVACLVAFSTGARSEDTYHVTGVKKNDVLNMRSSPKADASIVRAIPAGSSGIVRVGECKAWCQVRYDNVEGWVDRRFLAPEPPSSAEAQTTASNDPIGDCNNDDGTRKLAGCSAIIKEGAVPPAALAVAHSRRSDAYLHARNFNAALADRAKALELQTDDAGYKLRLTHVYALRAAARLDADDVAGALADYSEIVRLNPSNEEAYLTRSGIYVRMKQYEKAIADIQTIAKLQGETAVHRATLARLHEQNGVEGLLKGDVEASIGAFTEAIRLGPSRESAFLHRAAAYATKKDLDRAQNDYAQAARINPDNPETYIRRGELARVIGSSAPAILYFNEALKRDPHNVTARMLRGLAYEEAKQFDEAIADYRAVLKLDPSHKLAKTSLARLNAHSALPTPPSSTGGPVRPAQPAAAPRKKASDNVRSPAKQGCFVFNDQTVCN